MGHPFVPFVFRLISTVVPTITSPTGSWDFYESAHAVGCVYYTPTQRGNYHPGIFRNGKIYDESSGSLGRWLSMTTAMGVSRLIYAHAQYICTISTGICGLVT